MGVVVAVVEIYFHLCSKCLRCCRSWASTCSAT